jgi:hypothetical protein
MSSAISWLLAASCLCLYARAFSRLIGRSAATNDFTNDFTRVCYVLKGEPIVALGSCVAATFRR